MFYIAIKEKRTKLSNLTNLQELTDYRPFLPERYQKERKCWGYKYFFEVIRAYLIKEYSYFTAYFVTTQTFCASNIDSIPTLIFVFIYFFVKICIPTTLDT